MAAGRDRKNNRKEAHRYLPYIRTAVVVLVIAGMIVLIWLIVSPFIERRRESRLNAAEASSSAAVTSDPEKEDGSGSAGREKIPDGMSVRYETPGWQHDENGWWYACDDLTCYVNGWITIKDRQYHINGYGYMDTGWVAIGGKGCYFEKDGTYNENADSSKLLALTFDDGPCKYTPDLLNVLQQHNVTATFFMLGTQLEQYGAQTVPKMAELGCQLGNHSYDHKTMTKLTTAECVEEFQKTDQLIKSYGATEGSSVVRFPYGSFTTEQKQQVGKPNIYWDVDTSVYSTGDAAAFVSNVEKNITGGNIILINEGKEAVPEAVNQLISDLTGQGYQFVTVEELAAAHGYRLEDGVTYYGFSEEDVSAGRVTDQ
ncbi:MAG: polysaccharide deacetylase family protein [Lachnospiraceae bacterium]|jgi:peptidoglycan/xylan/chitin deacetylase (PgdA/CDA1 family)|nr:polysaccharide deacetylase family protein [Lachnospiraceae bacterium]MCI1328276.1 polysaccharide deacetylase family protein [Lachnospiraceae bacterium]